MDGLVEGEAVQLNDREVVPDMVRVIVLDFDGDTLLLEWRMLLEGVPTDAESVDAVDVNVVVVLLVVDGVADADALPLIVPKPLLL